MKLSPYYSSLGQLRPRRSPPPAPTGSCCFNRFYQPDLDVDTLEVIPRVELSSPWELRLPLRWIAILRPLAAGPCRWPPARASRPGADVAKALLVGADVAMMTSALLRHGPEHVAPGRGRAAGVDAPSTSTTRSPSCAAASATPHSEDPSAFERANYVRTLHSWVTPPGLTPSAPSAG